MRKNLIILCLTLVVVFILLTGQGCGEKKEKTESPFVGGTTGLLINFMEGAPPAEAYDGGDFPFDIDIKLENEGEYNVEKTNAVVKISGVDPTDFGKTSADFSQNPEEDLEGTRRDSGGNVIQGTVSHIIFSNLNYGDILSANTPFTLRADVCYTYGTIATSKLCIKEDLLSTDEGMCEVNEAKDVFNSGAPVQVTSFEESATGSDKVSFIFKVEHKGNGDIYRKSTTCSSLLTDENKVYVKVNSDLAGLQCSGLTDGPGTSTTEGYITLYGGERVIRCTQEANYDTDFEKPVRIELIYDYSEDKTTQILIKHTS